MPLNLAVSLVTVATSLFIRGRTLSFVSLETLTTPLLALMGGAVVAAFLGTRLAGQLSEKQLERVIVVLLLGIGTALLVEAFLPQAGVGLIPPVVVWQVVAGIGFGLAIGLVSSLLGVAGGELIIPTLIFAFGADIKTAGTASLLVSLPTVAVGILRYARQQAFVDRSLLSETIGPMGAGSVIGALAGGLVVGLIPVPLLKVGLGLILIILAWRMFGHTRTPHG